MQLQSPNECTLDNEYLTPNIVYETNHGCKGYLGASETPELSRYIWNLKPHGITPLVKWSIVKRIYIYIYIYIYTYIYTINKMYLELYTTKHKDQ